MEPLVSRADILDEIGGRQAQMEMYEAWADPAVCIAAVALTVLLAAIAVALVRNRVRRTGDPGGKDLTIIVAGFCAIGIIAVVYMVWCMHAAYVDAEAAYDAACAYYAEWYS